MVLCAVRAIWANPRYEWAYRRFAYFDLHAGPGLDEGGNAGSPLVVLERARALAVPLDAVLFEQDHERAEHLGACMAARGRGEMVLVHPGRCEDGLGPAIDALSARARLSAVYGLVYADPTTVVPWPTLVLAARRLERADILISLPAATEKRLLGAGLIEPADALRAALGKINKRRWFIRTLMRHHQFTFLLGTNYADMKDIKRIGLVPLESEQGQRLFTKAAYTHAEGPAQGPWQQLALPGWATQ